MGHLALQGGDRKLIRSTIEGSFTVPSLHDVVRETYERVEREVAWDRAAATVISEVVDAANRHGVLDRLAVALAAERPHVEQLLAIVLRLSSYPGWTVSLERHGFDARGGLEALTSPNGGFFDTARLAHWLIRTERQVCQVRCGTSLGTGFLVGSDLVLTCYHVVAPHLAGAVSNSGVAVRFDYRRDAAGNDPADDAGAWIGITPNWAIPHARYSAADLSLIGEPGSDELDYALLRLARPVGREPPEGEPASRGWVDVSSDRPLPHPGSSVLIVQHPGIAGATPPAQRPLQITFDGGGFRGANATGTRVSYRPSTLPGSSGSPVHDGSLLAVALHHNRGQIDPAATELHLENRGIPLARIRAHLAPEIRSGLVPPP
jgi:hypothetical protein